MSVNEIKTINNETKIRLDYNLLVLVIEFATYLSPIHHKF